MDGDPKLKYYTINWTLNVAKSIFLLTTTSIYQSFNNLKLMVK